MEQVAEAVKTMTESRGACVGGNYAEHLLHYLENAHGGKEGQFGSHPASTRFRPGSLSRG